VVLGKQVDWRGKSVINYVIMPAKNKQIQGLYQIIIELFYLHTGGELRREIKRYDEMMGIINES
jgi:hypothetical protein